MATLMQIVVPNNQLGRVGGGFSTISDFASIVSMGAAGAVGSLLGIPTVFVIAGILCAIMGFVAWALLPAFTLKDMPREGSAAIRLLKNPRKRESGEPSLRADYSMGDMGKQSEDEANAEGEHLFQVFVDDNFHYMDESERYRLRIPNV